MLVLGILRTRIFVTYSIFIISSNQWFNYIIILTFLGGIIVLFIYVSSLIPNEEISYIKSKLIFIIILIIWESTSKNQIIINIEMIHIYSVYWHVIWLIVRLIIILLIFAFKIIFEPFNPLKSFNL